MYHLFYLMLAGIGTLYVCFHPWKHICIKFIIATLLAVFLSRTLPLSTGIITHINSHTLMVTTLMLVSPSISWLLLRAISLGWYDVKGEEVLVFAHLSAIQRVHLHRLHIVIPLFPLAACAVVRRYVVPTWMTVAPIVVCFDIYLFITSSSCSVNCNARRGPGWQGIVVISDLLPLPSIPTLCWL